MHISLGTTQDIEGFAAHNAKPGEPVWILSRDVLTSDDQAFYLFIEQLSRIFLIPARVLIDQVYQFLVVIHGDLTTDLYINDFPVAVEMKAKTDLKKGQLVTLNDIADIRRLRFPDIQVKDTDKVVYCFKVGWRFGLFFDLTPRVQPVGASQPLFPQRLDVEEMEVSIGSLYRYLSFHHVYKVLESGAQFKEMTEDGWFPFVELLGRDYERLAEAYQTKFDFDNMIARVVDSFSKERITEITARWWSNPHFQSKKAIIEAGVNAYLQNHQEGFINCIKNLFGEIDGLLRFVYFADTGKGDRIRQDDLISHLVSKARDETGADHSLLFTMPFLGYLRDVAFAKFSVEGGNVPLSRHSSGHGVAAPTAYTKTAALQVILTLDQIYFYAGRRASPAISPAGG